MDQVSGLLLLITAIATVLVGASAAGWRHHGLPLPINFLRPWSGSGGHRIEGVSCESWRFAVETNNARYWKTVPAACEKYVGNYMLGERYRKDSEAVVAEAVAYAEGVEVRGDGKDVWVFDIDETSLSNLPYYANHGFGADAYNSTSFDEWVREGTAPALPESLKLYKKLLSLGIKVVFLTGRTEPMRNITVLNLKKQGFGSWKKLLLKEATSRSSAVGYKSSERQKLTEKGYRIVGNIGDQWSDILGSPEGDRTFKLPDPMYYIS